MHIGAHLRKEDVDDAADDVVAPNFVVGSEGLLRERRAAVGGVGVLLVDTRAALLDGGAESAFDYGLNGRVAEIDTSGCLNPLLQLRDPGLVVEDAALVVKSPECGLYWVGEVSKISFLAGACCPLTCERVVLGLVMSCDLRVSKLLHRCNYTLLKVASVGVAELDPSRRI
jgi:hypothetical protein